MRGGQQLRPDRRGGKGGGSHAEWGPRDEVTRRTQDEQQLHPQSAAKPQQQQMLTQQQQQQHQPQQQLPNKPVKGIPSVVPDFVIPNKESPTATTASKFPEAPNLMQKFSEMTGGADDIISKGKELIFMKFGLGK